MDLTGFDANTVDPAASREPVPAGWYRCVIVAEEEKPTKAQTGSYLQLDIEIVEGPHQGRKVFERLNLNNPSQDTVDRARSDLSSICRATGVMMPKTSADLLHKPLMVKVKVRPAKDGYDAQNEVVEYAAPDKAPSVAAPSATTANSTPPWKR
jgi:hypothetical protein